MVYFQSVERDDYMTNQEYRRLDSRFRKAHGLPPQRTRSTKTSTTEEALGEPRKSKRDAKGLLKAWHVAVFLFWVIPVYFGVVSSEEVDKKLLSLFPDINLE